MTYRLNIASLIFGILFIFGQQNVSAQGPDTSFTVPKSPLLSKLLSLSDLNTTISLSKEADIIPLKGSILAPNGQELIKQGKDLYVIIEQTGFVYKLNAYDSATCIFIRLDHTVNLNYNIDCKTFFHKDQLFSFGGYGFWKSNGHLRKFNFEDKEWDIIPVSEEIMSSNYTWLDSQTGRLYVPFQRIVNAGIIGADNVKGVNVLNSYYLDLDQKTWIRLGNLNAEIAKMMQVDYNASGFINIENGLLHLFHDEAYIFDFKHNQIYKSHNADFNQFLIRRASFSNMFVYKGFVYSYVPATQSFNLYPFKMSDFTLLKTGIWGNEKTIWTILYIIVGIVVFLIGLIALVNRIVKRKIVAIQLRMLKSKTINQAFSATEEALIQLIMNASLKETTVDIHQINHVLGIKDKNIGLQKKVRSDVTNAINDKYEFITHSNALLIMSSRKEDDKRYFEYFINPSEIKNIQGILESNSPKK
jgi:hypothetical protein